jgi:ABC-type microcin C transport system duplicated ATPase subunit YejF
MRTMPKRVARYDGAVRLDGRELRDLSDEEYRTQIRWRRMAMVFQGAMNVLNPVLKVGDQVMEPLLLDARMDKRAARAGSRRCSSGSG